MSVLKDQGTRPIHLLPVINPRKQLEPGEKCLYRERSGRWKVGEVISRHGFRYRVRVEGNLIVSHDRMSLAHYRESPEQQTPCTPSI